MVLKDYKHLCTQTNSVKYNNIVLCLMIIWVYGTSLLILTKYILHYYFLCMIICLKYFDYF